MSIKAGVDLIKLKINLLTLFESFIFSQDRKIMIVLIKWSSLQKSESKFTPKKFYEIDPRVQCHKTFSVRDLRTKLVFLRLDQKSLPMTNTPTYYENP